jgi:ABC-2 type transport system ATP-binding protein
MLELKHFTKIYPNGKVGAKDITLDIKSGDIFAFIGPNGAGKTTTIKSIVGINDITEGDIFVDGISVKNNAIECKKRIAYIPDNPDIYASLTGLQFINLIADIFGVSFEERQEKTEKYAGIFEIKNDLNSPISTYSHGMKQKVVLISALVHSPKLLVLDEPFVGLDPKASFALKEIMKEFVKEGNAIFFSTHVLEVAEKLCNKVAIINHGKIVANGKMSDIRKDKELEDVFLEIAND